jgi:hypothetical protein
VAFALADVKHREDRFWTLQLPLADALKNLIARDSQAGADEILVLVSAS